MANLSKQLQSELFSNINNLETKNKQLEHDLFLLRQEFNEAIALLRCHVMKIKNKD